MAVMIGSALATVVDGGPSGAALGAQAQAASTRPVAAARLQSLATLSPIIGLLQRDSVSGATLDGQ
jgi:hypothetical protein